MDHQYFTFMARKRAKIGRSESIARRTRGVSEKTRCPQGSPRECPIQLQFSQSVSQFSQFSWKMVDFWESQPTPENDPICQTDMSNELT